MAMAFPAVEEQWPMLLLLAMRRRLTQLLTVAIAAVLACRSALYVGGITGHAYVCKAFDARLDNLAVSCLLAVALTTSR